ncbi:hypothetical protein LMG6871_02817 [Ralstonia edaphis]|uniref:tail fiber assembly protein n=1 Tax=Ralstonia edaphi TaxID=3058599 RepID=UPI0028F54BE0|nr:tail fiber assembly protein [Ralstonia sp. LMG 6871]CAJ0719366.1 hypothetical protein LMG6871_02817 [Ralstonia sp. LMG 6871]
MKTYARIDGGVVFEIIQPFTTKDEDGNEVEVPIEQRFTPEIVQSLVEITKATGTPDQGWTFDGKKFSAPVAPVMTLTQKQAKRSALLDQATQQIAPLQDAVDLQIATSEESASLAKWKAYRVALNRLDLTVDPVAWPAAPA